MMGCNARRAERTDPHKAGAKRTSAETQPQSGCANP